MHHFTKNTLTIGLLSLLALSLVPGQALAHGQDDHHGNTYNNAQHGNGYGPQAHDNHGQQVRMTAQQQRDYQVAVRAHEQKLAKLHKQELAMQRNLHQAHNHHDKLAARKSLAQVRQHMERENNSYRDLLLVQFGIVIGQLTADAGNTHW